MARPRRATLRLERLAAAAAALARGALAFRHAAGAADDAGAQRPGVAVPTAAPGTRRPVGPRGGTLAQLGAGAAGGIPGIDVLGEARRHVVMAGGRAIGNSWPGGGAQFWTDLAAGRHMHRWTSDIGGAARRGGGGFAEWLRRRGFDTLGNEKVAAGHQTAVGLLPSAVNFGIRDALRQHGVAAMGLATASNCAKIMLGAFVSQLAGRSHIGTLGGAWAMTTRLSAEEANAIVLRRCNEEPVIDDTALDFLFKNPDTVSEWDIVPNVALWFYVGRAIKRNLLACPVVVLGMRGLSHLCPSTAAFDDDSKWITVPLDDVLEAVPVSRRPANISFADWWGPV